MEYSDFQDSYLCGLISILPVARRRPKTGVRPEVTATFKYRLRCKVEGQTKELDVCKKAFLSVHGIGKKKS